MFSPLESEVLLGRDVQQGVVRTEELISLKIQFSSVAFRKKPCRAEYWLVLNTSPSSMNQLSDVWVKRGDTLRGKSNAFRYSSNFTGWEAKLILISDLLQVSLVFQIACLLCSHLPPTKNPIETKTIQMCERGRVETSGHHPCSARRCLIDGGTRVVNATLVYVYQGEL